MKLHHKQTRAIDFLEDQVTTEVYYGGAAGGGKSAFGCYWQLKNRFKYPGTRGFIGRSELKTLKKTTLNSFFEVCGKQGVVPGKHFNYNQQDSIIRFVNGSEIILADLFTYPTDPEFDNLGSLEITDAFIDEAPQVSEKAKNIVKSRIRFKLDEFGLYPKLLMTGNPSKNWAYYEFYQPWVEKRLPEHRQFIQALVWDNVIDGKLNVSPHYIESLRHLDPQSRARLLDGDWQYDSDPATLISYDKILKCFRPPTQSGTRYLTADIARFGTDKTVIGVWTGLNVKMYPHHGLSIDQTANKIREFQVQYGISNTNTIVDEDGVGGGVVDILRCKGFVNNSKPLLNPVTQLDDNFANLKSQCYFKLAELINDELVTIDCTDIKIKADTIQELEQVKQYNMDKDSKRQVLPKDKVKEIIGRSPDYSDTLMMRAFFELSPKFIFSRK